MKKYILLFILILCFLNTGFSYDSDWSENSFPFSTQALGSGRTFTNDISSNYITPFLNKNDNYSNYYFSTSLLKNNIKVYYIVYFLGNFSFDMFYYDWNKLDYRDEKGNDLGEYYSANYSFSTSYTKNYKNLYASLQMRYNLKEIGNQKKSKMFIIPSIYYNNKNYGAGLNISDIYEFDYSLFASYKYKYFKVKTKIDYLEESYYFNYGIKTYLNKNKNYSLLFGSSDGNITTGLGVNNSNIFFNYSIEIANEQIFINSFSLKLKI